jgi:hypothetical protein
MQKWEEPVLSMFLTTIHAFWQIATRMHKHFQEDRYLYWSVISTILQVRFLLSHFSIASEFPHCARRMIQQHFLTCVPYYTSSLIDS